MTICVIVLHFYFIYVNLHETGKICLRSFTIFLIFRQWFSKTEKEMMIKKWKEISFSEIFHFIWLSYESSKYHQVRKSMAIWRDRIAEGKSDKNLRHCLICENCISGELYCGDWQANFHPQVGPSLTLLRWRLPWQAKPE